MEVRALSEARARGPLEPVGPLVQRLLRQLGLERQLEEYRAVEAWSEVVGPAIAAQARAVAVRDGVLFVDVVSNVWMQELGLLRDSIAERLNAHLGAPLVRKVVLSIERRPRSEAPQWHREEEEEESHD
jgi:predicted nucleic acid-binding Zn ribbon protein